MLKGWNARSRLLMVESKDKEKVGMLACVAVVHRLTRRRSIPEHTPPSRLDALRLLSSHPHLRSDRLKHGPLCCVCSVVCRFFRA